MRSSHSTESVDRERAEAYKQILVRKEDWGMLGWNPVWRCRAVELLCTDHAVFWITFVAVPPQQIRIVWLNGAHFIDYATWHHHPEDCRKNLDIMLHTCKTLGFTVQPQKIVPPTTCIEILGIVIDTQRTTQTAIHVQIRPSPYQRSVCQIHKGIFSKRWWLPMSFLQLQM